MTHASTPSRSKSLRDAIKRRQFGPIACPSHHVADQFDRAKLRIDGIHARRMAQEVEHRTIFDAPGQRLPDHVEKPLETPAPGAKSADVADGAHGNFDEA